MRFTCCFQCCCCDCWDWWFRDSSCGDSCHLGHVAAYVVWQPAKDWGQRGRKQI